MHLPQRDHDLADLLIAFEVRVGLNHLFEPKYTIHFRLERTVGEPIVDIPLHPFKPFRRLGLRQKIGGQRNALPYTGHGV